MSRTSSFILALPLLCLALPRPAAAQSFPAANQFVALPCGGGPMIDGAGDTPNAAGALDLVGSAAQPAGFHAADAQFLYLRLRVAATPLQGGRLSGNAWGFELDLDGDRTTYELLISVSGTGAADEVAIFRNPSTTIADSPADPAALPPAFTYPFSTHARVTPAGSTLGGGADTFIDLAVPWADLGTVGVQRDTPVYVWAGSSTLANALDLDLACFSGAGGQLTAIDVGPTAPDPAAPGGGGPPDGGTGTGTRTLEGGPGCSIGATAPLTAWLSLAIVLALALIRRHRAG